MLRRIRPYLTRLVASVILTVMFSLLSSASVIMTMPILKALFGQVNGLYSGQDCTAFLIAI